MAASEAIVVIRNRVLPVLAGLIAATALAAGPEDEIRGAEKNWAAAVMKQDYTALAGILSDELIYAHSTGVVETKGEYLGKMKAGGQRYDLIDHVSLTVRVFGDAAVAHARVRMKGQNKGEPFDNQLMMMHFWVKQGGRWRLVAHQTTRLS